VRGREGRSEKIRVVGGAICFYPLSHTNFYIISLRSSPLPHTHTPTPASPLDMGVSSSDSPIAVDNCDSMEGMIVLLTSEDDGEYVELAKKVQDCGGGAMVVVR